MGTGDSRKKGRRKGGSARPLLANLYLHDVCDLWAAQWRRRHARGDVIIVRYGDDCSVGFQHKDEDKERNEPVTFDE